MRIIVDADACPVKDIIERTAKKYSIDVVMFVDENHILYSDYSKIITVSQGKDAVDIALANNIKRGDIAVTQDYGVASLALGKGAFAIGMTGLIYDSDNIDRLMFERFLHGKIRNSKTHRAKIKHIKKRSNEDDTRFEKNLVNLIKTNIERSE